MLERRHLRLIHETGVIVFVPRERRAISLYSVGYKTARAVRRGAVERLQHRFHVMPGQIGHQGVQGRVIVIIQKGFQTRSTGQITQ